MEELKMEIILNAKMWGVYYDSCDKYEGCGGDNGACKDAACWGDGQVTDDCRIGA
ncbi:MAG: hypothetical protein HFE31_00220 [Clostridia bacterium]|jgi:hypothetical protein|nr:hypothetical protein [Clostridia bacterium]